jgi:hypothetical protein
VLRFGPLSSPTSCKPLTATSLRCFFLPPPIAGDDAHKPPVLTHAILDLYVPLPRCTLAISSSLPLLASLPLCFSLLQAFALVLGASFPLLYCSPTFACFATHTKSSCLYLLGPYLRPSVGSGGSCAACLPRFFAQLGLQLARARHLGWNSGPTAGIALVPWAIADACCRIRRSSRNYGGASARRR